MYRVCCVWNYTTICSLCFFFVLLLLTFTYYFLFILHISLLFIPFQIWFIFFFPFFSSLFSFILCHPCMVYLYVPREFDVGKRKKKDNIFFIANTHTHTPKTTRVLISFSGKSSLQSVFILCSSLHLYIMQSTGMLMLLMSLLLICIV